jgi:hypothetical protein
MDILSNRSALIWRWPAVLAMLTVFGLLSALLGQGGIWWALSWAALSSPILVVLACIQRRRRRGPSTPGSTG